MNWLGWEGLLLTETFFQKGKEKCKATKGLFSVLSKNIKPHHNHTIISWQYQKLKCKSKSLPRSGWVDYEQK